ncbi:MAG: ribonuclease H-like domain-containing protein [Thermodesulfovibrionales bacterium]|nr:ribonuclease H-like domain-containing protein [Thermodesulfovibrionales bacterium]
MSRVIFDIETVGKDFESLDRATQEYLLRYAETEGEKEEIKGRLSFHPLTGEIVTIGLLDPDTQGGRVFFQNAGDPLLPFEEDNVFYETGTEKEILEKFWNVIKGYDQFITFNGRSFDCPFILIRSAIYRIKPRKDLMPYRYNDKHIDILEQLTFYGASRRRFNLDMWCRTFGIKSPKEGGITGDEVKELFKAGRYLDIARYCVGDLRATRELLIYWENYIKFSP